MTDMGDQERNWNGQGPKFNQLLQAMFAASDEQALWQIIDSNPIVCSYLFIEYRLWATDTIKKRYVDLIHKDKLSRTPAEKEEMRLCQKQLTQLKVITNCISEYVVDDYRKRTEPNLPDQPPAPPKPAQEPALDERLIGAWEYSTYLAAGGLSVSRVTILGLFPDGHFQIRRDAYANMTHRNMYGDETGRTSAGTDSPYEKGRWQANGQTLRLDWSNGAYDVYNYEVDAEGMFWTPVEPNRKPTLWQRLTG